MDKDKLGFAAEMQRKAAELRTAEEVSREELEQVSPTIGHPPGCSVVGPKVPFGPDARCGLRVPISHFAPELHTTPKYRT